MLDWQELWTAVAGSLSPFESRPIPEGRSGAYSVLTCDQEEEGVVDTLVSV